jgi:hypothetical protein
VIWAKVDAFLAPGAGSAPVLAAVAPDFTEHKLAEEALRDARADLERMRRLTTMGELTASIGRQRQGVDPAVAAKYVRTFFTTKSEGLGMGSPSAAQLSKPTAGACGCPRDPQGADVRFTVPLSVTQPQVRRRDIDYDTTHRPPACADHPSSDPALGDMNLPQDRVS